MVVGASTTGPGWHARCWHRVARSSSHNAATPWLNCAQACIHEQELQAWLDGRPSPSAYSQLSLARQQQSGQVTAGLRRIVLFSLNDYLGLSTHPEVRAAAAAAAQQVRAASWGRQAMRVAHHQRGLTQLSVLLRDAGGLRPSQLSPGWRLHHGAQAAGADPGSAQGHAGRAAVPHRLRCQHGRRVGAGSASSQQQRQRRACWRRRGRHLQ